MKKTILLLAAVLMAASTLSAQSAGNDEDGKKIDKEKLKQAVQEKPDAYLEELAKPFNCSIPAVFYALKKMGITLKKRRSLMQKNPKKNGKNT